MFWTTASLGTAALTVWMAVHCYRHDPDRGPWLIVILLVPTLGPVLYFLARWIPSRAASRWPRWLGGGKELKRLRWEAETIGNPHQYVALGEALRERGKWPEAREAFETAVARDPDSPPALWGAAVTAFHAEDFAAARGRVERVLAADDRYKFGDASLLRGKCLAAEGRLDDAIDHMTAHTARWRQPEGLLLLARLQNDAGSAEAAAATLRELLGELDHAPPAVARRHWRWRGRARKLLRQLESAR